MRIVVVLPSISPPMTARCAAALPRIITNPDRICAARRNGKGFGGILLPMRGLGASPRYTPPGQGRWGFDEDRAVSPVSLGRDHRSGGVDGLFRLLGVHLLLSRSRRGVAPL